MDPGWKRYYPDRSWLEQIATHRQECCCWLLSTFSCARVAHHNSSTNPPTRETFKPIFYPHFLGSTRSLHNSLLHLLLTPRGPSLNLHQSDVVRTPSDAGRWPLLSHMRLLQELPASSYLSLLPAATARRRPNTVRVLYSTKYKAYNREMQIQIHL